MDAYCPVCKMSHEIRTAPCMQQNWTTYGTATPYKLDLGGQSYDALKRECEALRQCALDNAALLQGKLNECDELRTEGHQLREGMIRLNDVNMTLESRAEAAEQRAREWEAKYRYALVLIDAADDDLEAGMSGVAFSAQVPISLIDGKSASQIAELLCEDAALQSASASAAQTNTTGETK